jgi:dihydropteroate synthase
MLDPGIGFGKNAAQSLTVLARLKEFATLGYPLLVGASRKSFIGSITPSQPRDRLGGSIAAHVIAAQNGANMIRTHDVAETIQALKIASAIGTSR